MKRAEPHQAGPVKMAIASVERALAKLNQHRSIWCADGRGHTLTQIDRCRADLG